MESLRDIFDGNNIKAAERMLSELKQLVEQEGVRPECVKVEAVEDEGNVPVQIVDAAKRHRCDTIVIGRRGKSMVGQFFTDSVAARLLRDPIGITVWVVE